jgi:hypothetical protein
MANLITIDYYKQAKAISSAKDDERISLVVDAVSQLVKTYCGVSFVDNFSADLTEFHTIKWKENRILLEEDPIVSITSVEERYYENDEYYTLTSEEYSIDTKVGLIQRLHSSWPVGIESVKVTYKAGYTDTPVDLKLAIVDLVHYYLQGEYKSTKTLSGATVTNKTTNSISTSSDFPDHIKRVLDLYRHI